MRYGLLGAFEDGFKPAAGVQRPWQRLPRASRTVKRTADVSVQATQTPMSFLFGDLYDILPKKELHGSLQVELLQFSSSMPKLLTFGFLISQYHSQRLGFDFLGYWGSE